MHPTHHRLGAVVYRLEHPREPPRVLQVLGEAVVHHLAHPVQVCPCAERLARALQHHHARRRVLAQRLERLRQLRNQRLVEGVVRVGAVERDARNRRRAVD
jgi:hypothetical protein